MYYTLAHSKVIRMLAVNKIVKNTCVKIKLQKYWCNYYYKSIEFFDTFFSFFFFF